MAVQNRDAASIWARAIAATAPANGDVLAWNLAASRWEPTTGAAPGAHASTHASGGTDELTAAMLLEAQTKRVKESGGGVLVVGAIADGQAVVRSGLTLIGAAAAAGNVSSGAAEGRLSVSATEPVPVADALSSTTLYYLPAVGNKVAVYSGSGSVWNLLTVPDAGAQITNAGLADGVLYDVFGFDVAGVLTLELVQWTSDTVRATVLAIQNGTYVKSGTLTKRYLGTVRLIDTAGTKYFHDSYRQRFVWNAANRRLRRLEQLATPASWTYSGDWRQANADALHQFNLVVGVLGDEIRARVRVLSTSTTFNASGSVGLGVNSTTVNSAQHWGDSIPAAGTVPSLPLARLQAEWQGQFPNAGYGYVAWIERLTPGFGASAPLTFYTNNADQFRAAILGECWA